MKSNFLLLILFFITSCTSGIDTSIDVKSLKKEGTTYISSEKKNENHLFKNEIDKVIFYSLEKKFNWNYPGFNSSNFLKNVELNNSFSKINRKNIFAKSKKNKYKKDIVIHENKIIFVDDYSNLIIANTNLNLLKKIKIHKNFSKSINFRYSLISNNNTIFIADNLGSILAYDIIKNKVLWRNELGVPFLSNLSMFKNYIFVTNSNGKLFSFDALNGKQNWSYDTGTTNIKSPDSFKIVIFEDKLVFSNDFGFIFCLDLNKNLLLWTINIANLSKNSENRLFSYSNLILENNYLYLSSSYRSFFKINIETGNIIWENNLDTDHLAIISPDTISVMDKDGFFVILDKKNGKTVYKKDIKKGFVKNNDGVLINNFFIGSNKFNIIFDNGNLIQIDGKNLNNFVLHKITKNIISNIVINDNKIFFIDQSGEVNSIQ